MKVNHKKILRLVHSQAANLNVVEKELQKQIVLRALSAEPKTMKMVEVETGVGFEEIFPQTFGGKLFGTFISLIGIGVVAVPTGIVSASFVEILEEEKNKKKPKP